MKKKAAMLASVLSMLLAIGIILYPIISTAYNEAHQSKICVQHSEAVVQTPNQQIIDMRDAAIAYNETLHPISQEDYTSEMLEDSSKHYKDLLNLMGDGIMGYVEIPKIQLFLPIYHGTNEATLERGVGHLLGSSLPVGGVGTHTVLTAHSGMASQRMFSDLPQLTEGDTFYLHVLDEILAYQVDAVHTVLPHDTTYLGLDSEGDFCTLVTCTPFGVNTHRLLVRGTRIPYEPEQGFNSVPSEKGAEVTSNWQQEYAKGILCGIGLVTIILLIVYGNYLWRKYHEKA